MYANVQQRSCAQPVKRLRVRSHGSEAIACAHTSRFEEVTKAARIKYAGFCTRSVTYMIPYGLSDVKDDSTVNATSDYITRDARNAPVEFSRPGRQARDYYIKIIDMLI